MKIEPHDFRACAEFADRLVDLSDGELPASERQLLESHAANCPACRLELARLDRSLSALRSAVTLSKTSVQPVQAGVRMAPLSYYAAGVLSLAALVALGWGSFFRSTWQSGQRETAHVPQQPVEATSSHVPTTAGGASTPALDAAAMFRRIALLEQQARIQTSLDLMPKDPWFAEQRAANEELLATYEAATAVFSGAETQVDRKPSGKNNEVVEGETL